jgi:hypothetical protein
MFLEQSQLPGLCGVLVVSSSQDAAVPVGGIACGGPTRGLGGLGEVTEEAGNVVGLGDEGEQAHAAAAPWAGLDVDAEGSAEQLGPRPVARRAGLSRRIGVGGSVLIRVVARCVRRGPRDDERSPLRVR